MIDWKTKLTSRKMWFALAEFVGMLLLVVFGVAEDTIEKVVALIMSGAGALGYIIAEGLVDAKAAAAEPIIYDAVEYEATDEDVDPDGV